MRFLINRASQGPISTEAPLPEAVRGPESRSFPGEFEWYLDVSDMETLMRLLRESGGLGLFLPEAGDKYPVIEIFDEDEMDEE